MSYGSYQRWQPYVPVAARRASAARRAAQSAKDGVALEPVRVVGRKIATSFWGKAWCDNLERYSDYSNRLPRGRTYVRNGSVFDLKIGPGTVAALVSGSDIYEVKVKLSSLDATRWQALIRECSGHIGSLLDLLQGRFSSGVMAVLARREAGLFPAPTEIRFSCSCPDMAAMCKHVAAVLYGIGARLDAAPELFFALRQVDSKDLIAAAAGAEGLAVLAPSSGGNALEETDLAGLFGIEMEAGGGSSSGPATRSSSAKAVPAPEVPAKHVPTKVGVTKAVTPRKPRRVRVVDDGFGEVFGPDLEVSAALLIGFGVPRTTFTNWLQSGVLLRTTTRGVYRTTSVTLEWVRRAYARSGSKT